MSVVTDPNREDDGREVAGFDFAGLFRESWLTVAKTVLAATAIVMIVGAVYLWWWQPVRRTWTLEFRPTFAGASDGEYPNGLTFGPSDISAGSVMQAVFQRNEIGQYCALDQFRSGFFVEQRSVEFELLDLEFQDRLGEARLTAVERERLQAEYRARRDALPLTYRIVFAMPSACAAMPGQVVSKALNDVLTTWADQSEAQRGVLNIQVQVLSSGSLDVGLDDDGSRLIRADLIRTALRRLEANVQEVELLPGASLVRLGEKRVTFSEVRTRLRDLVQARLEPLLIAAGRGLGRDSIAWVDEALTAAARDQQVAEGKAQTYLDALREYSGTPQTVAPGVGGPAPAGPSDVQTLMPQIDRTFIDRIIDMSGPNTSFRQEMTRLMMEANIDAVEHRANVSHYEHMAASLRRPGAEGMTPQVIDARLKEIVEEGKRLADQFNSLYDEFSRVSLRASAMMFQTDKPVASETLRSFSFRGYVLLVAGTFLLSLVISIAVCLVRRRLRAVPVAS
jgi:hypothetical protein